LDLKQGFGNQIREREQMDALPRCEGETFAVFNNPSDGEQEDVARLQSMNGAHL
jgi:hypothetical protein